MDHWEATGMTRSVFDGFLNWIRDANNNQIAAVLDLMSVRAARISLTAEINIRRAAAAARQEAK